jgi:SRSO17 transposase
MWCLLPINCVQGGQDDHPDRDHAQDGPGDARYCAPVEESRAYPAILQGLLATLPRKSSAPMMLAVDGVVPKAVRAMQSFLCGGQWNDARLSHQHWKGVAVDLGAADGVLMVYGSNFPKQNSHSVGVKRQYCGALGKRANCQAGVFVGSVRSQGSTLLARSFMCPQNGSPSTRMRNSASSAACRPLSPSRPSPHCPRKCSPRWSRARRCGVVVADEAFGDNGGFLEGVTGLGLWYCAEVPHSTQVWEARIVHPRPAVAWEGHRPQRERLVEGVPEAQAVLYEIRSWTGWHHHMILVILVQFFVMRMSHHQKATPIRCSGVLEK